MVCSIICCVASASTGDTWAQTASERVELRWQDGHRVAHVVKCAHAESMVHYVVTRGGVRDAQGGKRKQPFPSGVDANHIVASRDYQGQG